MTATAEMLVMQTHLLGKPDGTPFFYGKAVNPSGGELLTPVVQATATFDGSSGEVRSVVFELLLLMQLSGQEQEWGDPLDRDRYGILYSYSSVSVFREDFPDSISEFDAMLMLHALGRFAASFPACKVTYLGA